MFTNINYQGKIILERNDIEEQKLNYKKIYNLSLINNIPGISEEKRYSLLITIKKILLCTNKYIDICNKKETREYCVMSLLIFLLYILVLSPGIKIYLLTEEESNALENFSVWKKFFCYSITQIIEVLFRLFFFYFRRFKTYRIFLYFAKNELNKIKQYYNIEINDNFDLVISKPKNKYDHSPENAEENEFFEYVICYPNVRYFNWDKEILNEEEKKISVLIKDTIISLEDRYIFKYSYSAIGIFVFYIFSFYFLTKANVKLFFTFMFGLFLFTKIMSLFLSSLLKKDAILKEEIFCKYYLYKGYWVNFSNCVIAIFKLKKKYEKIEDEEHWKEIYKKTNKQCKLIFQKFNIF